MGGKFAVNKTLSGYFDRIRIEHVDDIVWQAVLQKVAGVVFLGKDRVEESVMGIVQVPHTLYDGQIGPAAFEWLTRVDI